MGFFVAIKIFVRAKALGQLVSDPGQRIKSLHIGILQDSILRPKMLGLDQDFLSPETEHQIIFLPSAKMYKYDEVT